MRIVLLLLLKVYLSKALSQDPDNFQPIHFLRDTSMLSPFFEPTEEKLGISDRVFPGNDAFQGKFKTLNYPNWENKPF